VSWPERYRQALEQSGGVPLALDDEQVGAVLRLAKDVAHGSERRYAPLATFLAGQFVAGRAGNGVSAAGALQEALDLARQLLPPVDEHQGG
jgi:hypothetical protein